MRELGEGGIVICHVGFPAIDNSAFHSPCILIGHLKKTLLGGHGSVRLTVNCFMFTENKQASDNDDDKETKSMFPRSHKHKLCCLRPELIEGFIAYVSIKTKSSLR